MAVAKGDGLCTYELRIPFSELGVLSGICAKIGLSIQLNDKDGAGRVAQMNWDGGLFPQWFPRNFGVVFFLWSSEC